MGDDTLKREYNWFSFLLIFKQNNDQIKHRSNQARVEEAANLLSEGWPGRRIVKELADKYEVSAQSARSYVRKGRELLVEAVAPQDRAFMFAQVLAGLQQDRLDAKEAGNISAQVGASKAMVNHLKQIAHIDPMRDFEQAFFEAAASRYNGKVPEFM